MNYDAKYPLMQNSVEGFYAAARSFDGYARRLNAVKVRLGLFPTLMGYRNSIGFRESAVYAAANAAVKGGQCLDNSRIEYLLGEQRSYQLISGDMSFNIGDGVAAVSLPQIGSASPLPWWWVFRDFIPNGPPKALIPPDLFNRLRPSWFGTFILGVHAPLNIGIAAVNGALAVLNGFDFSFNASGPGYVVGDAGRSVTAFIGKISGGFSSKIGYGEVNAYVGKAKAEWDAVLNFNEKDGWHAEFKGKVSGSILSADGKVGAGDDMLGYEVKGEGHVGYGGAGGGAKFKVDKNGVDAYLEGEAMVSAVKGEVKGKINILGLEIGGKVEGYAGAAGVKGKVRFENGKFVLGGGAAALFGVGGEIEIGFNDTGWENAKKFVDGAAKDVGDFIGDTAKNIGNFANDAGKAVGDFGSWMGWW